MRKTNLRKKAGCLLRGDDVCSGGACLQGEHAPASHCVSPYVPLDLPHLCQLAADSRQLVREWEREFRELRHCEGREADLLIVCGRLYRARKGWRTLAVVPTIRRLLAVVSVDVTRRQYGESLTLLTNINSTQVPCFQTCLWTWDGIEILDAIALSCGAQERCQETNRRRELSWNRLHELLAPSEPLRETAIKICISIRPELVSTPTWGPTVEKFVRLMHGRSS